MLIIMGGLPATGKTTLARALARQLDAVHVRIDTIEQAIVRSGLGQHPLGSVGYAVGYALAEDHLRQGLTVPGPTFATGSTNHGTGITL
jgi:predicted kinase